MVMRMEKINQLFLFAKSIRSKQMRTNSFFLPATLEALAKAYDVKIVIGSRAAVVFYCDEGNIMRVYFYAADEDAIKEAVMLVPDAPDGFRRVCDVVGRGVAVSALCDEMSRAGFKLYARFQRMVCKNIPERTSLDLSEVQFALTGDAQEIMDMLYAEFDPVTAHFPSLDVIRERISNQEVFAIKKDGQIAGFTCFDSKEKNVACLEYVITREQYRGMHIARKILLQKTTQFNRSNYYYLWVNELCRDAIATHEKNNFFKDETYDYIFIF